MYIWGWQITFFFLGQSSFFFFDKFLDSLLNYPGSGARNDRIYQWLWVYESVSVYPVLAETYSLCLCHHRHAFNVFVCVDCHLSGSPIHINALTMYRLLVGFLLFKTFFFFDNNIIIKHICMLVIGFHFVSWPLSYIW